MGGDGVQGRDQAPSQATLLAENTYLFPVFFRVSLEATLSIFTALTDLYLWTLFVPSHIYIHTQTQKIRYCPIRGSSILIFSPRPGYLLVSWNYLLSLAAHVLHRASTRKAGSRLVLTGVMRNDEQRNIHKRSIFAQVTTPL